MNMLESAQASITRAAEKLGWTDDMLRAFLAPHAIHTATLSVGEKKLLAYRVQHSNARGPFKGGVRFHAQTTQDEVQALATLMSIKSAAIGIPMGGGKGGVQVDPRDYDTATVEKIARDYVRAFKDHIGPEKDVPAPDMNTDAMTMDWMVDEYSRLTGDETKASFTGKSIDNGGSLGREMATGRGGVIALREYLAAESIEPRGLTVAVQGMGNVGFYFAKLAEAELGVRVVAMSNSRHSYKYTEGLGMAHRVFSRQLGEELEHSGAILGAPEELLYEDVDVLVLAALEDVVTSDNQDQIKAQTILELANGPISFEASEALWARDVTVIPDVIANAGGVVVSYFEWLQNREGKSWSEDRVNKQLDDLMTQAVSTILERAESEGCSLKEAAFMVALERIG